MHSILVAFLMFMGQSPSPSTTGLINGIIIKTRPGAIPTSLTALISQDAFICAADVTATGQTITIEDQQGTPIYWISNALGSSGNSTTWMFNASQDSNCRWMPGGIKWSASASGATGALTIKCASGPCTLLSSQ